MALEWTISVSQLNEYVRKLISGDPMLRSLRVRGEISGFKRHMSGHLYFTLKDEKARVQCVMFRQNALNLHFAPCDGMRVTAVGSASLFVQNGSYQFYVDELTQEGTGELFLRFEALKQKLSDEGLFDPSLKKPLPLLPHVVGVVTSRTGAVLRDIVRVAGRRNPHVSILLAAASVQGNGAAEEIAAALDRLNRHGGVDVILVGRGGGSLEDLWPFNEEIVARAIARSAIPVVSCVGHETDFTITDFVADLRAPTPSAAAELAVPVAGELESTLQGLTARMGRAIMHRQQFLRVRLERLNASVMAFSPVRKLHESAQQLDALCLRMSHALSAQASSNKSHADALMSLISRMESAAQRGRERRCARVEALERTLVGLNPAAVLERGYAVVRSDGRALNGVSALSLGEDIDVRMRDGTVRAKVQAVFPLETKKNDEG